MAQEITANNPGKLVRDRLPILTKVCYGFGTALDMWGIWLYFSVAFAVFNIYLGVSPVLVGFALFFIRFYDAFTDPFMGWISDNLRTKYGRRRPFILIFGVLCGLGLPIMFLVSPTWSDKTFLGLSAVFWYMIVSNMIYIPIFSAYTVPFNSLANELSPDYEERTSIMTYRSVLQKIFEVGNFYALRFTNLAWFLIPGTGKQNILMGLRVYSCILGVVMAIFAIIIFFRVKERYYENIVVKKQQEHVSLKSALYETLTCRPFLFMLLVGACFNLGTSMLGTLGYYATVYYVCGGNQALGNDWNFWMGMAFMFGGLIGAPILNRVAYFVGKRNALIVNAFIGIIAYASSWYLYNPHIQWMQTIASGLMGLTASGLWMLYGSICADVIDYDELNTGKRREGSFTSCGTYIIKLGNSLGILFSGVVLSWIGYDSKLAAQTPHTVFWIRIMLMALPLVGMALVIAFILQVPLTKKICEEIRIKLEARRGQV
ncbi:MAG: MFS transporter [Sedimentisphaerales bacterium]|jgi:GPH family glycoside/pentoside/hexuronide:cation symporter